MAMKQGELIPYVFEHEQFGQIRGVLIDGEPWLVGKDVALALGYKNTRDALAKHVDDEDKRESRIATPSGIQNMTLINESGMYSLVLGSELPSAKKFKRWLTSKVLPAIRKYGYYVSDEKNFGEELLDIFSTYGVLLCLQSELSLEIKSVQNFAEQLRWLKQALAESPRLQAEVDSCIIGAAGIIERLNWFLVAVNSLKK